MKRGYQQAVERGEPQPLVSVRKGTFRKDTTPHCTAVWYASSSTYTGLGVTSVRSVCEQPVMGDRLDRALLDGAAHLGYRV